MPRLEPVDPVDPVDPTMPQSDFDVDI